MPKPVRTADPAADPIDVAEAKAHCNVDFGDDDALITALIAAATVHLDGYTGILGRALVTQSWRQDFGVFADCLRLPLEPVSAIDSVKYFDAANGEQTVATAVYSLQTDDLGSYVILNDGQSWPSEIYDRPDAVRVTFTAGYGAAADVPQSIKQAMFFMICDWYETRSSAVYGVTV